MTERDLIFSGPRGRIQLRTELPQGFDVEGSSGASVVAHWGGDVIVMKRTGPGLLGSVKGDCCSVVKDLFEGTADAGTVIQFCELEHHTDNLAHRMTNTDGTVTTWRS